MASRDETLLDIAAEALRVYWAAGTTREDATLLVSLPVLDGDTEVQVSVRGGVFTVRSALPGGSPESLEEINRMNTEMPAAAYVYVVLGGELWLQSKLAVPDLTWENVRPPLLGLAFAAGWQAARSGQDGGETTGPSSYDHFVYLADLLSSLVHEHWQAQQRAAALLLDEPPEPAS